MPWKVELDDSTLFVKTMQALAEELNYFEDIYDDEIWENDFCKYYHPEWVEEEDFKKMAGTNNGMWISKKDGIKDFFD